MCCINTKCMPFINTKFSKITIYAYHKFQFENNEDEEEEEKGQTD